MRSTSPRLYPHISHCQGHDLSSEIFAQASGANRWDAMLEVSVSVGMCAIVCLIQGVNGFPFFATLVHCIPPAQPQVSAAADCLFCRVVVRVVLCFLFCSV